MTHSNWTYHWLISLDQLEEVELKPVFILYHLLQPMQEDPVWVPAGGGGINRT